jgi:hypothetical protein
MEHIDRMNYWELESFNSEVENKLYALEYKRSKLPELYFPDDELELINKPLVNPD